jgi:asparagine synthase (glutamine-hydrolysing)
MCGIAGFIGTEKISYEIIKKSLFLMKNRGPDDQSFCHIKINSSSNIYLLHTRLSIIDLKNRSNQPFKKKHITLVFNGEIYNYKEIKKDLEVLGYKFYTESDTEVLVNAYLHYGKKCIEYFEGMWAFAIWDDKIKKLFLSRDRFGEKPLFYSKQNDGIYFSSDIRVIRCLSKKNYEYNISRLTRGIVCGYKSLYKNPSETFFKEILQVPQASYAEIGNDLELRINKYWSVKKKKIKFKKDFELIENARDLLFNSIKIRLRSDVPLAFCLSGGIDSGALVSVAAKKFNVKINSFSILDSKDIRYNEKKNIDTVVRDISSNHHEIHTRDIQNNSSNVEILKKLIEYKSGPIPTITYFLHSFLSKNISKNNFKVVMSGTAADEIYTGYYDHHLQYLYDNRNKKEFNLYKNNFEKLVKPSIRNSYLKKFNLYINNSHFRKHIYDNSIEFSKLLKKDIKIDLSFSEIKFTSQLLKNRSLNELFHETTPVILNEDDTNSMYYSIENRSPFLDSNLFDFLYSIPTAKLIQNGYAKFILRESVKNYLHEDVRMDRIKKGFNASITSIFDFSDKKFIDELLDKNSKIFEIFDIKKIEKIFNKNISLNHYSKFIFSFMNAKFFLDMKI